MKGKLSINFRNSKLIFFTGFCLFFSVVLLAGYPYLNTKNEGKKEQTVIFDLNNEIFKNTDLKALTFSNKTPQAVKMTDNKLYLGEPPILTTPTDSALNIEFSNPKYYQLDLSKWNYPSVSGSASITTGNTLLINIGEVETSTATSNLGLYTIKDINGTTVSSVYYPKKMHDFQVMPPKGSLAKITWVKEEKNEFNRYVNNGRIMFRLTKNTHDSVRYYPYERLNPLVVADNSNHYARDFIMGNGASSLNYVDFMFDIYSSSSFEENLVYSGESEQKLIVTYSNGTFGISGLDMDTDYNIQIYTFYDDPGESYTVITNEYEGIIKITKPILASDTYKGQNNLFTIENMDASSFPYITSYFSTKTPLRMDSLSSASIYFSQDSTTKDGFIGEGIENNLSPAAITSWTAIKVGDANKTYDEFQYPLDIVLCINNSTSMQYVADNIKASIQNFNTELENRHYNVKFNIVTFGPPQTKTYMRYDTNDNRLRYDVTIGSTTYNKADYVAAPTDITLPNSIVYGNRSNQTYTTGLPSPYPSRVYEVQYSSSGYYTKRFGQNIVNANISNITYNKTGITIKPVNNGIVQGEQQSNISVFRNKWFENISEVQTAVEGINPAGSYSNALENGHLALDKSMDLLVQNGRSLDSRGHILNDSTGTIKSSKWVILFSDDNMNLSGNTKSNLQIYAQKLKTNGIALTFIGHLDQLFGGSNPITQTDMRNKGSLLGAMVIDDTSPVQRIGTSSLNYGGSPYKGTHYSTFRTLGNTYDLGTSFHMYEMGSLGEFSKDALMYSLNDIGIIQRWKLTYLSPFTQRDGKQREIKFGIKTTDSKIMTMVGDVNDRRYRIAKTTLDGEIINPVTSPSSIDVRFKNRVVTEGGILVDKVQIEGNAWDTTYYLDKVEIKVVPSGSAIDAFTRTYTYKFDTSVIGNGSTDASKKNYFSLLINSSDLGVEGKYDVYATIYNKPGAQKEIKISGVNFYLPGLLNSNFINSNAQPMQATSSGAIFLSSSSKFADWKTYRDTYGDYGRIDGSGNWKYIYNGFEFSQQSVVAYRWSDVDEPNVYAVSDGTSQASIGISNAISWRITGITDANSGNIANDYNDYYSVIFNKKAPNTSYIVTKSLYDDRAIPLIPNAMGASDFTIIKYSDGLIVKMINPPLNRLARTSSIPVDNPSLTTLGTYQSGQRFDTILSNNANYEHSKLIKVDDNEYIYKINTTTSSSFDEVRLYTNVTTRHVTENSSSIETKKALLGIGIAPVLSSSSSINVNISTPNADGVDFTEEGNYVIIEGTVTDSIAIDNLTFTIRKHNEATGLDNGGTFTMTDIPFIEVTPNGGNMVTLHTETALSDTAINKYGYNIEGIDSTFKRKYKQISYKIKINKSVIYNAGKSFDMSVSAKNILGNSSEVAREGVKRPDIEPPKLINFKMNNNSLNSKLVNLEFSSDAEKYSSITYYSPPQRDIVFIDSTEKSNNGYFATPGAIVTISAEITDETLGINNSKVFDTSIINNSNASINIIKADFHKLNGIATLIAPTSITKNNDTITAVWKDVKLNASTGIKTVMLKVVDARGNDMSSVIEKIDTVSVLGAPSKPTLIKAVNGMKNTSIELSKSDEKYITNLGTYGVVADISSTDKDNIRAKQINTDGSDETAILVSSGNEYIAFGRNTAANTETEKKYKVKVIDNAGNESEYSSAITVIEDTKAPVIGTTTVAKTYDSQGILTRALWETYEKVYVKNGDKVSITIPITESNRSTEGAITASSQIGITGISSTASAVSLIDKEINGSAEGINNVTITARDRAGNISNVIISDIYLDNTSPTTNIKSFTLPHEVKSGWGDASIDAQANVGDTANYSFTSKNNVYVGYKKAIESEPANYSSDSGSGIAGHIIDTTSIFMKTGTDGSTTEGAIAGSTFKLKEVSIASPTDTVYKYGIKAIDKAGNAGAVNTDKYGVIRDTAAHSPIAVVNVSDVNYVNAFESGGTKYFAYDMTIRVTDTSDVIGINKIAITSFTNNSNGQPFVTGGYTFGGNPYSVNSFVDISEYGTTKVYSQALSSITAVSRTGTTVTFRFNILQDSTIFGQTAKLILKVKDHLGNESSNITLGSVLIKRPTSKATIISNEQAGSKEVRSKIEINTFSSSPTSSGINIKTRTETGKTNTGH